MSQDESSRKPSKVKRTSVYDDSEPQITLEPVADLEGSCTEPIQTIEPLSLVQGSVAESLTQDLIQNPSRAIQLVKTLSKITRDWEPIGSNGAPINETPVPPGKNPKDFIKTTSSSPVHISGFRLTTIFGDEVAMITKDSPKWRVTILGEYQVDTPFVQHSTRAEFNAKQFAENKLREKGYIIGA